MKNALLIKKDCKSYSKDNINKYTTMTLTNTFSFLNVSCYEFKKFQWFFSIYFHALQADKHLLKTSSKETRVRGKTQKTNILFYRCLWKGIDHQASIIFSWSILEYFVPNSYFGNFRKLPVTNSQSLLNKIPKWNMQPFKKVRHNKCFLSNFSNF